MKQGIKPIFLLNWKNGEFFLWGGDALLKSLNVYTFKKIQLILQVQ